jgi:hypothetical protein
MKSVEAIQKVKVLPRVTASHQPGSNTRWREETNVRSRVEHVSRVCIEPRKLFESGGSVRDTIPGMSDRGVWEARTVSSCGNAISALSLQAREGRGHRGPRPDHVDKGIARELVRASSASCLDIRGAVQSRRLCGESTARPKLPLERPAAPPGRSIHPKCGDDRSGGTSGNAEDLRTGARQSERIRGAMAPMFATGSVNEQAPGPRQPGETCAPEARVPVRQGTNAVRGTGKSEGEAGRHRRTKAGHIGTTPTGQETPSFLPIPLRLERIATQAQQSPDMAFTTLAHHLDVALLGRAFQRLNPQSAPGVDRVTWRRYKANLETNLETLHDKRVTETYSPQAVVRRLIPKGGGQFRPLGLPALEAKIVAKAVERLLESIYEQDFYDFSHGFRPGRSPHQALHEVRQSLVGSRIGQVLDCDIRSFFDTLQHDTL